MHSVDGWPLEQPREILCEKKYELKFASLENVYVCMMSDHVIIY